MEASSCLACLVDCMKETRFFREAHNDNFCLGVCLNACMRIRSNEVLSVEKFSHESSSDFSFEYVLSAESLRSTDPLPYILHLIITAPGLDRYASHVFMIISELYSNALEHGVLKLSSSKKDTLDGFSAYYEEREQLLSVLEEGFVKIQGEVISDSTLGKLILQVTDSGSGFDYQDIKLDTENADMFFNRGLALLNQLCDKLEFSNEGRSVTAHFYWHPS